MKTQGQFFRNFFNLISTNTCLIFFFILGGLGFKNINAQEFFSVKTNFFLGNQRSYGALIDQNAVLVLTASSDQASGKNTGGLLFVIEENTVQKSLILSDANGKELFIKNICQLLDNSFVIFYSTDEEPFPTVTIDGRLYCARFNTQFELLWNFEIDTGGNSVLGKFLQSHVSEAGVVIFSFFGLDAYYIGGIKEDGQLLWNKKVGAFNPGTPFTSIFNQAVQGEIVLFTYYQSLTNQSFVLKLNAGTGTFLNNIVFPEKTLARIAFTVSGWVVAGFNDTGFFACTFDNNDNLLISKQFNSNQVQGRLQISQVKNREELVITVSNINSTGILRLSYGLDLIESSLLRDFSSNYSIIHSSLGIPTLTLIGNQQQSSDSDFVYTILPVDIEKRSCRGGELCFDISNISIIARQQAIGVSNFGFLTATVRPNWRAISSEISTFCTNDKKTFGISASFNFRDTLCTMALAQVTDLENGGAREVLWEFPGASSSSSTNLNPPEIFYPTPGEYTLRQIVKGICSLDTFERTVHVIIQPTLNLPTDTILCNDSIIRIVPIYDANFSGRWLDTDDPAERTISNTGIYYFEVSNQEVCIQLDSISINFISADIQINGLDQSCEGPFDLDLSIDLTSNFKNHIWSMDPPIESTLELPDRIFFDSIPQGSYIFSYSIMKSDCPFTVLKEVNIYGKPIIEPITNLRIKDGVANVRPIIKGDFNNVLWSDGFTGLSRLIQAPGSYQLKVTNFVCADSTTFLVLPAYAFFAPNAFRPAGDFNPTFKIYTNGEISIDGIEIYDRWGSLLAICNNNLGWDGTSKGLQMPPGIYIFQTVGETEEGEKVIISGEFTLFE